MSARRCAVRLVLVEFIHSTLLFVFISASVMANVLRHSFYTTAGLRSSVLGIVLNPLSVARDEASVCGRGREAQPTTGGIYKGRLANLGATQAPLRSRRTMQLARCPGPQHPQGEPSPILKRLDLGLNFKHRVSNRCKAVAFVGLRE